MSAPISSFKQGDATWHALRKRALGDLYYFNEVVLGYGPLVPMRPSTHLAMCRFAERRTGSPLLDEAPYQKIEVPRGTGKTTLVTQGRTIQRICRQPEISIMLANEAETTAKKMLSAIKHQFESNDLLRALFPEVIPPDLQATTWSATEIIVNRKSGRKEPTIFVKGVGGTATGMHPDEILVDDAISREAMENARTGSRQIMEQVNRWIHQLEPLLNNNADYKPQITFIGTRWFYQDCYEHIEDAYGFGEEPRRVLLRMALPDGKTQQIEAYRVGDLAVFRRAAIEDGQSIFPEQWDLDKLAKMRMTDPILFSCNFMNQPADDVTAIFKTDWIRRIAFLDEKSFYFTSAEGKKEVRQLADLDLIIIIDPGGFGQGTEDRMRAAAWVLGDDMKGNYFGLDCYSERDTYVAAIRQVVNWCQRYPIRKVYSERAGQQAAFAQLLRQELQKAGLSTIVDDTTLKPEGKAKEVRVLEMEPYFQRGQFYIGTGPQFHEFQTQFTQFPMAARVDLMDALGYFPRLMKKRSGAPSSTYQQQQQAGLNAYRARLTASRRS